DGYVYVLWAADTHWKALKQILGNPDVLASEIFDTLAGRHTNDDVLRPMVKEELARHDMEYLVREGQKIGLTIGPVHTVAQAANHPHLLARDAFIEIDHPVAGPFKYPHRLVSMTATPPPRHLGRRPAGVARRRRHLKGESACHDFRSKESASPISAGSSTARRSRNG